MIKINEKEYALNKTNISWGNFKVTSFDKTREGVAPFISFSLDCDIEIGLEFTYSKEMFEQMKLNEKIDLNNYLTDITYEDGMGWISMIIEDHNCYITKVNKNDFNIEFKVESESDNLNIIINHNISLLDKE